MTAPLASPGDTVRAMVASEALNCLHLGPSCCAEAAPGYDLETVSWCQIFWLHCLRKAGLTTKVWGDLARNGWVEKWLPRTRAPRMGDLSYIHKPKQHGAIYLETNDRGIVSSVDGNSSGRVVLRRERPYAAYSAFYSIQPLVDVWIPQQYRETSNEPPSD